MSFTASQRRINFVCYSATATEPTTLQHDVYGSGPTVAMGGLDSTCRCRVLMPEGVGCFWDIVRTAFCSFLRAVETWCGVQTARVVGRRCRMQSEMWAGAVQTTSRGQASCAHGRQYMLMFTRFAMNLGSRWFLLHHVSSQSTANPAEMQANVELRLDPKSRCPRV